MFFSLIQYCQDHEIKEAEPGRVATSCSYTLLIILLLFILIKQAKGAGVVDFNFKLK